MQYEFMFTLPRDAPAAKPNGGPRDASRAETLMQPGMRRPIMSRPTARGRHATVLLDCTIAKMVIDRTACRARTSAWQGEVAGT
jgi:hypothetical protein